MKFLITGGTGNIGSFLVDKILSKGFKVNYLTRDQRKVKKSSNLNGFFWNPDKQTIDQKNLAWQPILRLFLKHLENRLLF